MKLKFDIYIFAIHIRPMGDYKFLKHLSGNNPEHTYLMIGDDMRSVISKYYKRVMQKDVHVGDMIHICSRYWFFDREDGGTTIV